MTVSLLGTSPAIEAIRRQVRQLAARQRAAARVPPMLILGETGTGKGLLARTIHLAGPRRDRPFVDVNCAAIPETLLEAELFGYERGAFTDARQAKAGLFQTAHGGTLFLDEIGLLPAAMQGKLLTALEDHAVRRLGGTRVEPVDIAIIAATSIDVRRAVAERRFREDLFHRIALITLELPPLRARGTDLITLAEHFLARACADYRLSPRALTPEARALLVAHRWPGNVRELANAMERVALLSDRDVITAAMLEFLTPTNIIDGEPHENGSLEDALRGRIEAALSASGGNIRRTATALGISRNTLRARMDKYGLRRRDGALPRASRTPPLPTSESASPPAWRRAHLAFLRVRLTPSSTADGARVLDVVAEKVRSFGGRLEESSPTGAIAVFGIEPVENPSAHAALAALAIRHAAERTRPDDRARMDVAMAIDCAEHLVNDGAVPPAIGIDGKADTWSSLETLVAAGLSGAILVSARVVPFVTRRFALEPARTGEPGARLVPELVDLPARWRGTRFVGRATELGALRRAAALAEQRHGQVVAVVGDAGVGKSRLVHEAVQSLEGWRVLAAGGAPYSTDTPYHAFVTLLERLCHLQPTDGPADVQTRVAQWRPTDAGPILDLLGALPPGDPFCTVEPAQRRRRTHAALRHLFLAASATQPLCLVVEDLHWIDSETQEVLDGLVAGMSGARLLLLVNYRPEYQHAWGSRAHYTQIRLGALPIETAGELLDALLGVDARFTRLKDVLVKRGNPFFLEETVQMLVDTKVLVGERGRYQLAQPIQSIDVPLTVQAMLRARIDRLPLEDRRVLEVAAAIGKDAPLGVVRAVADLPEETLRARLDRLQAAELVFEAQVVPEIEYTFKHALTHEVVYTGMLEERRRALHATILTTLERLHDGRVADHAEVLAHHAERAGIRDKAVRYLRHAGVKAATRSANREAIDFFERALTLLRDFPETPENLSAALDVRIALGAPLIATHGPSSSAAEASYRAALELTDRLDDGSRRFPVLWGLWYVQFARGDYAGAVDAGERLLDIARKGEDPAQLLAAHHTLWPPLVSMGEVTRALPHLERGLALYSHERHASIGSLYGGHDPGACCHCFLAASQWALGYPDRARGSVDRAIRLADALGHANTSTMTLGYATSILYLLGDRPALIAAGTRCMALIDTHGFKFRAQPVQVLLYAVRDERPDVATLDALQSGRLVESMPTWHMVSGCALARLYGEAGAPERGLEMLSAMGEAEKNGFYGPEIVRVEGELRQRLAPGAPAEAARCFELARELARRRQLKSFELRAATSLARSWRDHGRRAEARRVLGEVYASFTEGFDTPELTAARILLTELA